MMRTGVTVCCRILSAIFLIMLLWHWRTLMIIFHYNYLLAGFTFMIVRPILYLIFNLAAMIGLFNTMSYGFWCSYIAIAYTTYFYHYSYIPKLDYILPYSNHFTAVVAINVLVLLIVVVCHMVAKWRRV